MPSPTREPEAIPARRLLGYESPSEAPEATGVELLVLKRGPLFAVTNRLGDIAPAGARDQGLFFRDTRYLSHYALAVAGGPPVVLSSQTSREYVTQIDMTCTRQGYGGVFQGDTVVIPGRRVGGEQGGGGFKLGDGGGVIAAIEVFFAAKQGAAAGGLATGERQGERQQQGGAAK